MEAIMACLLVDWGVTLTLMILLVLSEWLAKTNKVEENGILDVFVRVLRETLRKKSNK